jgi:ubiquinone/menaquinone biosynthesis C-methylase UbiE
MSGLRKQPSAQRFDRIWQDYHVQEGPAARVAQHEGGRARFLRVLNDYAREAKPRTIVEVGCGSAIDLCLLRSRVPSACAMGLDLSLPGLQVAHTSAEHLHVPLSLCQGDVFTLPLRSGTAGLVFSQGVLEHFDDPRTALAEQARVLAPGGVLVVSVPQTFTGYTLHKHKAIRAGVWPWGWEGQFSSRGLRALGRDVGLEVERVFGYQYWLSWAEPTWVLRDLIGKVERRVPAALSRWVKPVSGAYDRLWNSLEETYGHLFLLNVAAVFRAKGTRR